MTISHVWVNFITDAYFCISRILEIYIPIRQFFYNLIHPEYSAVTDVYVVMFLADTVDFIIIVFGFWAFGVRFASLPCHQQYILLEKSSLCNICHIVLTETFGSCWHHFLSVRGSGTWGVSGDGTDPVWYYGGRSCAVPEEDCHGEGHLSGHPGLRHSLLDVLYSTRGHWEVQ